MRKSLLEQPRLSEIETKLNDSRVDEAQRLLAALPDGPGAESARVYFATRILFERGRLDRHGVIERLRELLRANPDFPEAERMLHAAERNVLQPHRENNRRTVKPGATPSTDRANPPSDPLSVRLGPIPRAPLVPEFGVNMDAPSYAPPPGSSPTSAPGSSRLGLDADDASYDTLLSPPPPSSAVSSEEKLERPLFDPPTLELPRFDPPTLEFPKSEPRTLDVPDLEPPTLQGLDLAPPTLEFPELEQSPDVPALEVPASPSRIPRVPSLEIPAQRAPTLPPSLEPASTIPSPQPPPSSRPESQAPEAPRPTLLEIANALDRGACEEALALARRAEPSPELSLLSARVHARLGELEDTELELRRLLRAPLLEPSLRAATARLLIELGFPTRALEQARHALEDDPKDPLARVTCAWALVRVEHRTLDPTLSEQAEPLLSALRLRDPTLSALLPGLRAWVSAQRGDPTRALSLAQTALGHEPDQLDAHAAIALASLKLGLVADAERAMLKLKSLAPDHAADLEAAFLRAGLALRRSERSVATEASIAALFGEAETALVRGRPELSILGFERACGDRLRALSRRGGMEAWSTLAAAAARLFTELPVLRHFAPYDCSIFSVDRLRAALEVLFGSVAQNGFGDDSSVLLAGAYYGETLRQAFGGEWHGTPERPRAAVVQAMGLSIRPCERVARALHHRESLTVEPPANLHPAADPFGNSVPLSLVPPCPWDPEPWPSLQRAVEIGRLLPHSVVGAYCAKTGAGELDFSVSGVGALDRYVGLLAPLKAPPALDTGWVRRASVFVGAYLGEVLVRAVGARWQEADPNAAAGAGAYRLLLKDGTITTPVARAFDRLSGRRVSPLAEYVARVVGGKPSLSP